MQYKLNGFLWLGLGLVIQAMAGVFISFGLGAGYYYVFTGVAAAALIVEIIGVSIVRGSGREFIWGRGLVIISAILEALSMVLLNGSGSAAGNAALYYIGSGVGAAALIFLLLGIHQFICGSRIIAENEDDQLMAKKLGYAWKMYLGLVIASIVLAFFAGAINTITISAGIASQIVLVVGAALVSLRLIQMAAEYNGKEIR